MSEESKCQYKDIKDYKSAFECFKQRFLVKKKSIFRLDCEDKILDKKSIKYLVDNFIHNGYIGDGGKKENQTNSIEKFHHQLTKKNLNEKDEIVDGEAKNAIEILATAVWLWRLPASNTNGEGRRKSVQEILDFNPDWKCSEDEKDNKFFNDNKYFDNYNGFAMPGIGYNTNKANELAYIILFFEQFLDNKFIENEDEIINYLKENQKVTIQTTNIYTKDKERYKLTKLKEHKDENSHISVNNGLLHLFDNENYEPILSNAHKDKIVAVFSKLFEKEEKFENMDRDKKIATIKKILQEKKNNAGFYDNDIKNIWLGGIDFENKNMILHGAPGTGKTYLTEQTIKTRKLLEGNLEYTLVQFHPSYSYEDFIEGIKPTKIDSSNGQMEFELKNGVFKQMCIDAFQELIKAKKNKKTKKFYFIADEINRAELSRVFGELLLCLEDDKRLKIENNKVKGVKIGGMPNSNLWETHHAVVILDEKDEIVNIDDVNENTNYKYYFGVPENIYFIGTMNDIDRSVDSFDMALRRRFNWKHYRCDYDVIYETFSDKDKIDGYIEVCKKLNEYIVKNLGNSYELGHSYFMKPKTLSQKSLNNLWHENIAPLLREYLRSEFSESDLEAELKKAKKIFEL